MTPLIDTCAPDVMQVCRNGHVITDRLHTCPASAANHCDRCGATTLDRCPTCGKHLPGAVVVPGLAPVGRPHPPAYCATCGAAFPWTRRPAAAAPTPLAVLETMLRRLPRVARQLRTRQGDRPPFRVDDERDLEDLLRALLPLHFDDVRPESRTPAYAATTRTDFLIVSAHTGRATALTAKRATPELREGPLTEQWRQDVACYEGRRDCRALVGFVYDPEGLLRDPATLETAWSRSPGELELRCVVAW
jgi:hypothetical protein